MQIYTLKTFGNDGAMAVILTQVLPVHHHSKVIMVQGARQLAKSDVKCHLNSENLCWSISDLAVLEGIPGVDH